MALTLSETASFTPAPEGVHGAICFMVADLGTQPTVDFKGNPKQVHKLQLAFEILSDERMDSGQPFSISHRFTASLHEKSSFRPFLQSWRGKAFTEEELRKFDVGKLLGAPCLLNIVHETKDGKTYSNIGSISPLPKGMPKPEAVNKPLRFDLDAPDWMMFESLPARLQESIKASAEWPNVDPTKHGGPDPKQPPAGGDSFDDFASDIPF